MKYPVTPDGRYFVHGRRLWRCTNPHLDEATRQRLVKELMLARRAVRDAKHSVNKDSIAAARASVNAAKVSLGERGPVWWDDDSDFNRMLVQNTPYAEWFETAIR